MYCFRNIAPFLDEVPFSINAISYLETTLCITPCSKQIPPLVIHTPSKHHERNTNSQASSFICPSSSASAAFPLDRYGTYSYSFSLLPAPFGRPFGLADPLPATDPAALPPSDPAVEAVPVTDSVLAIEAVRAVDPYPIFSAAAAEVSPSGKESFDGRPGWRFNGG